MSSGVNQPEWDTHPAYGGLDRTFKGENYEMKEELGKGGFGTVRRCVLRRPGGETREFAAKINNTPEKKRDMENECMWSMDVSRKMTGMICPCHGRDYTSASAFIVRIFDSITEGDIVYNFYEMATGGDLGQEIERREFLPSNEAADAIRQILLGLDHVHHRGLIHRDIKPANILIQSKSVKIYKVGDFGLCRVLPRDPATGQYVKHFHGDAGTPHYKPPETFTRTPYDFDFDIWSCGVMLYEMIAGYRPFWEDDVTTQEQRIRDVDFIFPSPEWDGLDDEQEMIESMLRHNRIVAPPGAPPNQIRLTFDQLTQLRFYKLGEQQPLPQPDSTNPFKSFTARRNLKRQILNAHWQAQAHAQAIAPPTP